MFFWQKKDSIAWIVVFLGNPGLRYDGTRHNVGFLTADIMARELDIKINRARFNALTAVTALGGEKVLFVKPQTYMNLSGNAVRQAIRFYKLPQKNIIVVSDEISLPPGALRIRGSGSAGGHNGLRDIISKCGGEDFPRVRIGVGSPPHEDYDLAEWVLSKPVGEDALLINEAARKAAAAVELIVLSGVERAMSKYN